ncbi:hypothetical protein OROHE_016857 [Orobanche hederae]
MKGKTKSIDTAPSSPSDNDSDDDDSVFQAGLRMSREDAQDTEFCCSQAIQGQGTSKDASSPYQQQEEAIDEPIQEESIIPLQPKEIPIPVTETVTVDDSSTILQEESVPRPDQREAERQQEDLVPPVPSSIECHVPEAFVPPQDEYISHPSAEPSTNAPASPCSQPDDEFLPEDSPCVQLITLLSKCLMALKINWPDQTHLDLSNGKNALELLVAKLSSYRMLSMLSVKLEKHSIG